MFRLSVIGEDGPVVDFEKGTVGGKAPDPEIAAMAFGEKPWTAEKLALVQATPATTRTISPPMFTPNILQPMQPGFTAEQQQSLNPAAYAQQQAAQEKKPAAPSSNKTLYIIGGVVVGLALLYFMFSDRK